MIGSDNSEINTFVTHRDLLNVNVIFLTGLFILVSLTQNSDFISVASLSIALTLTGISSFLILAMGQWNTQQSAKLNTVTRNKIRKHLHNLCISMEGLQAAGLTARPDAFTREVCGGVARLLVAKRAIDALYRFAEPADSAQDAERP